MFKGINVVSIEVPDLEEAKKFYGDVLALGEPLYDLPDDGWIEFGVGGTVGNLAVMRAGSDWRPCLGTTVVLTVEDCEAAWRELKQRNVHCDEPVVFPGYVTYCSFYDPFGNRLQICGPAPEKQ